MSKKNISGLKIIKPGESGRTGTGYSSLNLNSRLNYDKDIPRSFNEIYSLNQTIFNIVENLDEYAIDELLKGNVGDIDMMLTIMAEEAEKVLYQDIKGINQSSLQYVDKFSKALDEYLKDESLNYFILTTLPSFDIEWFHIEWGNFIQLYRKLAVLAARGHGKSFFFSWALILWRMFRYKKPTSLQPIISREIALCKEGMLITNEYKLARKLLKKVKDEIEDNDILGRKLKPDGREGLGNEQLRCKNGAQLDLSSFHSSNRGPHPGWIILDDFLDKSALYSNDQREKFWESFSAEITNMLLPGGALNVVGTPFHNQDIYGRLKEDPEYKVFEYPAIYPNGNILSKRFPIDELLKLRRSLGSLIFTREYLVKPISELSTIFPYTILNNALIGMQSLKLVENIQSYPIKFKKVSVGVDFAISSTIGADYFVITVWGLTSLDEYHLIHIYRGQGVSHNEQIGKLHQIRSNFKPDVIIAESNGFQQVMINLAKESGIKEIQEFVTTGFNKKDIYEGLPALSALFERGQIKLPYGDEHSKNMAQIIMAEFNSITFDEDTGKLEAAGSDHDDTCMSTFFGIKGSNQINSQVKISLI